VRATLAIFMRAMRIKLDDLADRMAELAGFGHPWKHFGNKRIMTAEESE
jgi:hypothetical protein